jgi:hypothetical protein
VATALAVSAEREAFRQASVDGSGELSIAAAQASAFSLPTARRSGIRQSSRADGEAAKKRKAARTRERKPAFKLSQAELMKIDFQTPRIVRMYSG